MSSFSQILPYKNSNLWKGVGLGVAVCVLTLAIALSNVVQHKVAPPSRMSAYIGDRARVAGGGGGGGYLTETAEADGPKIVRTAELILLVSDCATALKKIEGLAKTQDGFVEASTLEEDTATITLRVPSERLDETRARLREFAIRVTQDSVGASDVTRQYFDREARLRNLRAREQQFLDIMKKAHTVPDVLAVTKNLSDVREEIEKEDGEFRRMKEQVEMAKIEAHLHAQSTAGVHWSASSSTRAAWNDFLQSLAGLADFLIWLVVNIPIIILWIALVFVLVAAGWYVLSAALRAMRAMFGRKGGAEVVE